MVLVLRFRNTTSESVQVCVPVLLDALFCRVALFPSRVTLFQLPLEILVRRMRRIALFQLESRLYELGFRAQGFRVGIYTLLCIFSALIQDLGIKV